jgi:hypothetical protein
MSTKTESETETETETETTVPETAPEAPEVPEVVANDDEKAVGEHDASDHVADPAALRKQAASYRRRLRDTETERDTLADRVSVMQRGEAERIAAAAAEGFRPLSDGRDVWRHDGVELGAMLDDDGNVDAAKVREVVLEVAAAHPGWRVHSFGSADAGRGAGAISRRDPDADFADALRGVSRG